MAFGDIKGTKTGSGTSVVAAPACATGTNFAVVAGDLIVALMAEQIGKTVTGVTDNLGNTYTAFGAGISSGAVLSGRAFWTRVTNAGTISALTFAATASSNNYVVLAVGFEGPFQVSPLDAQPAGIIDDNTTPYTCPTTGVLKQAEEKVICALVHNGNPTLTATAPNLLAVQLNTASVLKAAIGHQTTTTSNSVLPSWTSSATPTASVYDTVTFKRAVTTIAEGWSAEDRWTTNVVLSNGDKTATMTVGSIGGIRSTRGNTTGKFYAEFVLGAGGPALGLKDTTSSLTAQGTASVYLLPSNGYVYVNGTQTLTTIGTVAPDSVVRVAWDTALKRAWFAVDGGSWLPSGSNPSTGFSGYDISAIVDTTLKLYFGSNAVGNAATVRTQAAEFTYPAPASYTSWMGEAIIPSDILSATNLVAGSPTFGATTFDQPTKALIAAALPVGVPVLGSAAITQKHSFTATGHAVAVLAFGAGAITQNHNFTATNPAAAAPVLGASTLSENASEATGTGALVAASATRTNLAKHSQNILTATAWFTSNATTTSNSTTAADGTLTADTLTDNNGNAPHQIMQLSLPTEVGKTYTFSVYVKAGTLSWVQLQSVSDLAFGNFNVTNGTPGALGQKSAGATTKIDAVLVASFYRCSLTFTATQTATAAAIITLTGDNIDPTYTGTFQTLYLWGAQFEEGGTATTYIPTTTDTVTVPSVIDGYGIRRAAQPTGTGALQAVQQSSRINQILQSQTLDHSSWVPFGATVAANFQSPSDTTADKITDTTASTQHCVYQDRSATQVMPAGTYTMSAYVKRDVLGAAIYWFVLGADASSYSHRAAFNINTGVVGSKDFFVTSHAIQSIGNGWYRCSITFSTPVKPEYIYLFLSNADTTNPSYTGTGTGAMYVWGVQLEPGEVATEYIPTTTAPVTVLLPAMGSGLAHNVGEPVTTWDPAFKSASIELSDGNRTATARTLDVELSVRGTTAHGGTDKVHFEIVVNKENNYTLNVGLANASATLGSFPGMDDDNGVTLDLLENYAIYNNWSNEYYFTPHPEFVEGDVLGYSCDFANRKVYFSRNGVVLRGDPVAGTDGCPIRGGTADMYPWFSTYLIASAPRSSVLLRTTNLAYAPPAGYSEWDAPAAPAGTLTAASLAVGSPVVGAGAPRTNLLLRSQELDINTAWFGAGSFINPNQTTAPDSTTTADLLQDNGSNVSHYVAQSGIPQEVGKTYTASVYIKANTLSWIRLNAQVPGDTFANFDVSTGAVGQKTAGATALIEPAANGFYRCSLTTVAASGAFGLISIYTMPADNAGTVYTGTFKNAYLWGAQFEEGTVATAYIPTTTAPASVGGLPSLIQNHSLTAAALQAGSPALGVPALGVPAAATTFDPAKTSTKFALSNGNLTATKNAPSSFGTTLSIPSVGTKVYAEIVGDVVGSFKSIGLADDNFAFEGTNLGTPLAVGYQADGKVYVNNVVVATIGGLANSDLVAVALDTTTQLFQVRNITKAGAWTTPTATGYAASTALRLGFSALFAGSKATAQFTGTFVGTPPSAGYTQWNGEALPAVPISLTAASLQAGTPVFGAPVLTSGAVAAVTLDPALTATKLTLSNGNLTVTHTTAAGYGTASSHTKGAGVTARMYAEAVATSGSHGGNTGYGAGNNMSGFESNWLGAGSETIALYGTSIYHGGGNVASGPGFAAGDRIAVDVCNNPNTVSFRNVTTNSAWTTPIAFSGATQLALGFGVSSQSVGSKGTFAFATVVGPVPAGCTQWNGQAFTQFNLLASYAPATERGAFDGRVGATFTATKNIVVTKLGLRCGTNSTTHTAYLYEVSGTTFVGGVKRSVAINMTGGIVGVYHYGDVTPFTIEAGKSYFLSALVTSGDPQLWGDNGASKFSPDVVGSVQAAYTYDEALLNRTGTDNQFYGVDLIWEEATAAGTDSLTATSLAVAVPTIGTPQLIKVLTANNLVAPSPVIGLPTFGRVLSGANLATGPPALAAGPFTQKHVFVGTPLAVVAPTIGAPAFTQPHTLAAVALSAPIPSIGQGVFRQAHAFTATPVVAGAFVHSAAVLGQSGVMAAIPLAVVAPTIGAGTLVQQHTLPAAVAVPGAAPSIGQGNFGRVITLVPIVVAAPTLGAPTLTKLLTATNASAGTPVLGTPAAAKTLSAAVLAINPATINVGILGQRHVFTAVPATAGAPAYSAAVMSQAGVMAAIPLVGGIPAIGAGILAQRHALAADALPVTAPSVGLGVFGRVITATSLSVAPPTIDATTLRKTLTASNAAAGAPALGAPALAKTIPPIGLPGSTPNIGQGVFSQRHVFIGDGFTVVAPLFGPAVLSQAGQIAAIPVISGQPVFSVPALGQRHVLGASAFATGLPAIGIAALTQRHTTLPVSPVAIPPVIGTSSIGQKHAFTPPALVVVAPSHSAAVLGQAGVMAAIPIAVVSPAIGVAIFGQAHRATAQTATAGSPSISSPSLGKMLLTTTLAVSAPVLTSPRLSVVLAAASSLTTSPPVFSAPAFTTAAGVGAVPITTSAPVLGAPLIKQRHQLTAIGKTVTAPDLPELTLAITGIMSAVPAKAGAPVLGKPAIAILSIDLTAANLSAGAPVLAPAAMVVRVHLTAPSLAVPVHAVSVPVLGQRHALVATRTPVSPVIGTTQIRQEHRFAAVAVVAGYPIPAVGFLGQAGIMAAIPLWISSPVLPALAPKQRHRLAAVGVLNPAPILDVPDMGTRVTLPRAQSTYAGRFKGPVGVLGQVYHLTAPAVTVGPPRALPADLTPRSVLGTAAPAVAGSPALGAPLMGVQVRLVPKGLRYEYPVLGAPQLGQEHVLAPSDLAVLRVQFGRPRVAEERVLPDPIGIEVAAPILGAPALVQRARLYQMADLVGRRPKATIVGQRDSQVGIIGRSKRRANI